MSVFENSIVSCSPEDFSPTLFLVLCLPDATFTGFISIEHSTSVSILSTGECRFDSLADSVLSSAAATSRSGVFEGVSSDVFGLGAGIGVTVTCLGSLRISTCAVLVEAC